MQPRHRVDAPRRQKAARHSAQLRLVKRQLFETVVVTIVIPDAALVLLREVMSHLFSCCSPRATAFSATVERPI